jgi:DNA-directed RNA polymerase subunit L
MKPRVSGYVVKDLPLPKVPKEYAHLLSKRTMRERHCEFTLSGVNATIANAIRRVLIEELPVKRLELAEYETNDEFLNKPMLASRLQMLPVLHSAKLGAVSKLSAVNKTLAGQMVTSGDFVGVIDGKIWDNIPLCELGPGKYLKITGTVAEYYPNEHGRGMAAHAIHVVSLPEMDHFDQYEDITRDGKFTKKSISETKTSSFVISFDTRGTIEPDELLPLACQTIIARLRSVLALIPTIQYDAATRASILYLPGETCTISTAISTRMIEITNIVAVDRDKNEGQNRACTIRMIGDEIENGLRQVAGDLITTFESISAEF